VRVPGSVVMLRAMRTAIGVALALAFAVALAFATLRETGTTCEVCVDYGGRSECRRSSAAEPDEAIRMAQSTACAVLASGVTRGIECQRTPPRSAQCDR
jgi:hypothetical protein